MKIYVSRIALDTNGKFLKFQNAMSNYANLSYFDVICYRRMKTKRVYIDYYKALNEKAFDCLRLTRTKRAQNIVFVNRKIVSDLEIPEDSILIETNLDVGRLFKHFNMLYFFNTNWIHYCTKILITMHSVEFFDRDNKRVKFEPFTYWETDFV